jgi:hypothetical protein
MSISARLSSSNRATRPCGFTTLIGKALRLQQLHLQRVQYASIYTPMSHLRSSSWPLETIVVGPRVAGPSGRRLPIGEGVRSMSRLVLKFGDDPGSTRPLTVAAQRGQRVRTRTQKACIRTTCHALPAGVVRRPPTALAALNSRRVDVPTDPSLGRPR